MIVVSVQNYMNQRSYGRQLQIVNMSQLNVQSRGNDQNDKKTNHSNPSGVKSACS